MNEGDEKERTTIERPESTCLEKFRKLPSDMRQAILEFSLQELTVVGYENINFAAIADKAGIAPDIFISCFPTTHDLLSFIIQEGLGLFMSEVPFLFMEGASVSSKLEYALYSACSFARTRSRWIQAYIKITGVMDRAVVEEFSPLIEKTFHDFFVDVLTAGKKTGEIREDTDVHMSAYLIDSLVKAVACAYAVPYHEGRLTTFIGGNALDNETCIVDRTLTFIESALRLRIP